MHEKIEPLNYCAHAIEDLKLSMADLRAMGAHAGHHALERVVELLVRSIKFLMPNRCELIDIASMGQAHLDMMRLPYPIVAFEAPWLGGELQEEVGGFPQMRATKRIALCWEADPQHEYLVFCPTDT